MATKVLFPTGLTYARKNKFPLESYKVFGTLSELVEYIEDVNQTAYEGLYVAVTGDSKNNGAYFITKVATAEDGTAAYQKLGGGSLTAETYSNAVSLATADQLGQIIYVTKSEYEYAEVEGPREGVNYVESDELPEATYNSYGYYKVDDTYYEKEETSSAGAYIVTGAGSVAKLGTTSATAGGDIQGELNTLKGQVNTIDGDVNTLKTTVNTLVNNAIVYEGSDKDTVEAGHIALKNNNQSSAYAVMYWGGDDEE